MNVACLPRKNHRKDRELQCYINYNAPLLSPSKCQQNLMKVEMHFCVICKDRCISHYITLLSNFIFARTHFPRNVAKRALKFVTKSLHKMLFLKYTSGLHKLVNII